MGDFAGSVWWLVVSLGLLVTFHEFGHYWTARRFGVEVLRFSVGFGPALWSRRGRDGTGDAQERAPHRLPGRGEDPGAYRHGGEEARRAQAGRREAHDAQVGVRRGTTPRAARRPP